LEKLIGNVTEKIILVYSVSCGIFRVMVLTSHSWRWEAWRKFLSMLFCWQRY